MTGWQSWQAWLRRGLSGVCCLLWLGLAAAADEPDAFLVDGFRFTGNKLLETATLEAVVANFKGPRSLAELRRAADAVQAAYVAAGYGGVVAYIPPQADRAAASGKPGLVTIAVVEGRIARVTVSGAPAERALAVRGRLPALVEGQTPRVRMIDSQIALANENPARKVQLLLKPGLKAGEIDADLSALDIAPVTIGFALDNSGNKSTGDWRTGLSWQHADLSGASDVLALQATTSPTDVSKVKLFSASYRRPVPAWLMMFDLYGAYSDVDGGGTTTTAGDVHFNGSGQLAGLRGSWLAPRTGSLEQRVGLALDWREYVNHCRIAQLGSGSCGTADANVTVTPMTLDYSLRSSSELPWLLGLSYAANLDLGGRYATDADFGRVRLGATHRFSMLRLNASALVPLADGWQLRPRLQAQWSRDALVPGEQFGIGGSASVRGYSERQLVGDSGFSASLELGGPEWLPAIGWYNPKHSLRGFAFAEGGVVSNNLAAPCDIASNTCQAASVGVGAQFVGPGIQARLAIGVALQDAKATQRGDTRAHFQLIVEY